jgi:hypothetical protein
MIYLNACLNQQFAPAALPAALRATLGKTLRRAAPLSQLALLGALACLPAERRQLPTALLWQSTAGPRQETLSLLEEVCCASAEPMPYDFLATQPAIAAAQIKPYLPGLQSATYFPQDGEDRANWALLISLAGNWLKEGRYAQVLCAHLESNDETASGHWLLFSGETLENRPVSLQLAASDIVDALPDTADFPARLDNWLRNPQTPTLHLQSSVGRCPALEFARP